MSSIDNLQGHETVVVCFLCQSLSAASTYSEKKLENNLKVIFLMRELLGIPVELCANYLQKYGDPSSWIHLCSQCIEVVDEGRQLFQKIKQLENKLKEFKTKVMCQAKVKSELNELDMDLIVSIADQEIRKDIFELYGQEDEELESIMDFEIFPDLLEQSVNRNLKQRAEEFLEDPLEDVPLQRSNVFYPAKKKTKAKSQPLKKKIAVELPKKCGRSRPRKIHQEAKPILKEEDDNFLEEIDISPPQVDSDFSPQESKRKESEIRAAPEPRKIIQCEKADSDPVEIKELLEEEELEEAGNSPPEVESDYSIKEEDDSDSIFNVQDDSDSSLGEEKRERKIKKQSKKEKSDDKPGAPLKRRRRRKHEMMRVEIKETKKRVGFPCPHELCDKILPKKEYFEDHYRSLHLPQDAITCPGCKLIFPLKQRYKFHLENAICLNASLKCSLCDANVSSQEALDIHIKFNHTQEFEAITEEGPNIETKEITEGFLCPDESCGKRFSLYSMENHVRSAHLPPSTLICSGCNENMLEFKKYNKHLEKNEDCAKAALKCPQCSTHAQTKKVLDFHIKIHLLSTLNDPYKCDVCGRGFKHKCALNLHMKEHDIIDQKAFICEKCGRGFPLKISLDRHIKNIHDDVKYLPCRTCGKIIRGSSNRLRHEILHREENPHQCTLCGKCFKMKNYLTLHMWSHDPDRHLKYSLYKPKGPDAPKYKKGSGANQRVKVVASAYVPQEGDKTTSRKKKPKAPPDKPNYTSTLQDIASSVIQQEEN